MPSPGKKRPTDVTAPRLIRKPQVGKLYVLGVRHDIMTECGFVTRHSERKVWDDFCREEVYPVIDTIYEGQVVFYLGQGPMGFIRVGFNDTFGLVYAGDVEFYEIKDP